MYRTHNCGELTSKNISNEVILSGWVQKIRNKGFIIWIDLRDRYGITQIIFDQKRSSKKIIDKAQKIGREFVIKINGEVIKRESVNPKIKTGEIEVLVKDFNVLNSSLIPPFTIQDNSDGGEELRLKYRYLDIRRNPIKNNLILRSKITHEIRNFLSNKDFKPLLQWIDEKLLEYTSNLNIDFKPINKNAWFQIYNKNDYQDYHTHPDARISAIYYLKGKKNSSPTIFTDFNFSTNYFNIINPTEDNSREWTIPFQEGVLLIFRSEVPHCVPKNINSERISIAINYK